MKEAIKLLQKVDENNFMKIFIVISIPASNVRAIESIAFLSEEEAQDFADWRNKKENTTIYRVFSTCMHI